MVVLVGFQRHKIDNSVDFSTLQISRIFLNLNGRGERIRTSDPLLPKQVRYQTALRPEPGVNGIGWASASSKAPGCCVSNAALPPTASV